MKKNISGQYAYFTLVSAISGNFVTGASGAISGRKSLDGLSGMIVLSGNIIELGGGSYRANLFDFDTNGNQAGFLFTSSGTVPVQYQFDMIDGNGSGAVWPASGVNVTVPIASISGSIGASGLFTNANVVAHQGTSGLVFLVNVTQWRGSTPSTLNNGNVRADVDTWRGFTPSDPVGSGALICVSPNIKNGTARSGTSTTVQLDATAPLGISGIYNGNLITLLGGSGAGETRIIAFYDSSGNVTVDKPWSVAAFANSVFAITPNTNPQSGNNWTASGINTVVPISSLSGVNANSGLNVEANVVRWLTKAPKVLVASGHVDAFPSIVAGAVVSGTASTIQLNGAATGTSGIYDGNIITLTEGLAKGQSRVIRNWGSSGIALIDPPWTVVPQTTEFYIITPTTQTASGITFPSLPKAALSGVVANSGLFVTATATVDPTTISGVFVTVPIATISGVIANSGLFVTVLPANLSGVVANSGLNVEANVVRWLTVAPNALLASGRVDAAFNLRTNVARSGTSTTIQLDASAPLGTSGIFDGDLITIIGGSGANETRRIAFYNSSGNVTVDRPWAVAAFNNSVFTITPNANTQSGTFVTATASVDPATISGAFVTVVKATISGVVANSGLFVVANATVDPALISGLFVTVPIATISGAIANSGLFVTVLPANLSGVVANSGLTTTVIPATISGTFASVPISSISGVIANSGLFVTVPIASISGAIGNSGQFVSVPIASISGVIPASGASVTVLPVNLSGVNAIVPPANLSGVFASVPISTLSGVIANSGIFASVPIATLSGVIANSGLFVTVPKATLSGVVANSGLFVNATTIATIASGDLYLASGSLFLNSFASGTLNEMAFKVLTRNVSGREAELPYQSVGAASLKLTSRFYAPSGITYMADGTTAFMKQAVTTSTSQTPIIELGVAEAP